ncbi:CST complex subunit STN1 [Rhineura floridana]|uniref:CST complex subunit STN1 n=1 Tax=Rhineura floridana TaxID=261503 RepID=UPI002AC867EA|nr:CST complex subunit STN1 [Rhineura floridana]XP_061492067.1 CST complex subunit STN1 [Rhineura floridana]XP_061492068.1 CST complex subunit STN1 [Rhineura floridana]XP_061492069.1 CST complex subunit STN1 [Rhineura floridana]XP_061492070.1 CST complex subunit STN1 [Rhineura floridana]
MFATATESEEEVPSLLWGLDPIFSAFARLYIKDIQEMKESKQIPGIFFYNRHPIRQVDILGTVVLTKERDAFHTYGVDDGTGVISCTCWKNPLAEQKSFSEFESHPRTSSDLHLVEQIRKLQVAICQKTRLEIGDIIRVRGCIRIYRQQREIKASMYYKVDDPMCEVQISRMLELPRLYRDIYDKPFQFQEEAQSQGAAGTLDSITVLSKSIRDFLLKNKIQSFYQQELETVEPLVSMIKEDGSGTTAEQTDSKVGPSSKLIRNSFTDAIKVLEKKGVLFQKSKNPKDMYYVTEQDKELHRMTLEAISADCKRPKYAEKGCHLRHILSCIQQSYSPYVSEPVVCCLLDWMETNSDVVTTMEEYYTVF